MDQYLLQAYEWCKANLITVTALLYIAVNVAPRIPQPSNKYLALLWLIVEKCMFLSWDRLPGTFKLPLIGPVDKKDGPVQ